MTTVDVESGGPLDKIHTERMFHAFAQLCLELIRLEDQRVNGILRNKGITIIPGPVVGIEYGEFDKQILESELKTEKARIEAAAIMAATPQAEPPAKKAKRKHRRGSK